MNGRHYPEIGDPLGWESYIIHRGVLRRHCQLSEIIGVAGPQVKQWAGTASRSLSGQHTVETDSWKKKEDGEVRGLHVARNLFTVPFIESGYFESIR